MKTVTVRQVRNEFNRVLDWIAAGEEVVVMKRKKAVARLLPLRADAPGSVRMPDFSARLRSRFGDRKTESVRELLKERDGQRW